MGLVDTVVAGFGPKDAYTCCVREHPHGIGGEKSMIVISHSLAI